MALSVDPLTYVISIPRTDLTLIQSLPTEIRELNLNGFRLELKEWEDDEEGIVQLKTHTHNTEVTLSGLTFARVIEVLDPYTITFEDGQYAVNLVGANSNVADRVNVNQVSVRAQNSAGLISTPLIEFASFENGVWWDSNNVTGLAKPGTLFPIGTRLSPALHLSDAKEIATYRGFDTIYVLGTGVLTGVIDFSTFSFVGQSHVNNILTIETGPDVSNAVFRDLEITGTLDGGNEISNCIAEDLAYVNGHIHYTGLIGDLSLEGSIDAVMVNCYTIDPNNPPLIDMGGGGQNLVLPGYSGLLCITNLTNPGFYVGVGLNGGSIQLENSVTNSTVHVSGIGELTDDAGNSIHSGTWNGNVTVINQLVNRHTINEAIWEDAYDDTLPGSAGLDMATLKKLTGNKVTKSGEIITIYEDDNVTPWRQYDLTDGGRIEV